MSKVQTNIKAATDAVSVCDYLDYRLFLAAVYERVKNAESSYSYEQFAADLGMNATNVLHQIIRGHRPLTDKAAAQLAPALALRLKDKKYFLALVAFSNAKDAGERQACFDELLTVKRETLPDTFDQDCLAYFSEWYHPVIWELAGTKGFKSDAAWIAKRITPRLKVEQVKKSLELLVRLNLLKYDADQKVYVRTQSRVSTGHRVKGLALVGYHQNMIDLGKSSLTRIKGSRRDVSAVTVNVSEEKAQHLRSMIHAFQLQLLDEAERDKDGTEVYQINIQLFPFTE